MHLHYGLKYNAASAIGLAFFVTLSAGCGKSGGPSPSTAATPKASPTAAPTQPVPETSDTVLPVPRPERETQAPPEDHEQWNRPMADDEHSQFDAAIALRGMGVWISIGGERFFKPDFKSADRDWQPYQHGYWTFDADLGWTWVSYDQWGSVTEHYGVWRHHKTHGWLWLAFEDRRYRPHAVTWFDDGDYVGWYPYYADYSAGYQHGYTDGFDDGYWEGYRAASRASAADSSFHLGFTVVKRRDVTVDNVWNHRVDQRYVNAIGARGCSDERVRARLVGFYPGGSREIAFEFIQGNARIQVEVGRASFVDLGGGQRMLRPHRVREVPQAERVRWSLRIDLNPALLDLSINFNRLFRPPAQPPEERPDAGQGPVPAVIEVAPPAEVTPIIVTPIIVTPLPPIAPTSTLRPRARPVRPVAEVEVAPAVVATTTVELAPTPVTAEQPIVPVSFATIGQHERPVTAKPTIRPRARPTR